MPDEISSDLKNTGIEPNDQGENSNRDQLELEIPVESIDHDNFDFSIETTTLQAVEDQQRAKENLNYSNTCHYLDSILPDTMTDSIPEIFPRVESLFAGRIVHFWPFTKDVQLEPLFGKNSSMRWPLKWYELKTAFKRQFCYVDSKQSEKLQSIYETAVRDTFEQIYLEAYAALFPSEPDDELVHDVNDQIESAARNLLSVIQAENQIDFEINCVCVKERIVQNTISRVDLFLNGFLYPMAGKLATKTTPFTYKEVLQYAKESNLFSRR